MKAAFALITAALFACGFLGQTNAQAASAKQTKLSKNESLGLHLPVPPYPEEARQQGITGSGICQASFGSSGHVAKAVVIKSTGSKILDDNAVRFALEHWTGPSNRKANVPIVYQLPRRPALTPANIAASGLCKVTFDNSGHAATAVMAKSLGLEILDKKTVEFALAHWMGRPNSTSLVPVCYTDPVRR